MRKSKLPGLYTLLRSEIRERRHGGPGDVFMPTRQLAEELSISLVSAHRLVRRLSLEGYLFRQGKRLFLSATAVVTPVRRVGALVTNIDNPFFSRLLNRLEVCGRKSGMEIISAGSDYSLEHERQQLQMLTESGAEGFLICPAHDELSAATLHDLRSPYVLVGRKVAGIQAPIVMVDDSLGGSLAARHLLAIGCRQFLYVGLRNFVHDRRQQGFCAELRRCQGELELPLRVLQVDGSHDQGELTAVLRASRAHGRLGVFAYHDVLAIRVLRSARLSGMEVPGELAVVGFDNLPIAVEMYPSLSSIAYSMTQIAEKALELLSSLVRSEQEQTVLVEPRLIIRESSAK